jgi:hypothetical protein
MLPQTIGGQYDPYLSIYGSANWDKHGVGGSAGVGDINGDGIGDFLVGSPYSAQMIANIYSGSDLAILRTYSNGGNGNFGRWVANIGDTDNDGYNDYSIACPDLTVNGLQWAGEVYLYSGATGTLMHTVQGQSAGHNVGRVGAAGDINADGYADYFIGATMEDWGGFEDAGMLYVYSGRTHQVLYQSHGNSDYAFWGRAFGGGFDLNQDGYGDFIAGSSDENTAIVYSGIDGSVIYTYVAPHWSERLGRAVCLTPDINNDGIPDFAISAFHITVAGVDGVGEVYIYSGADGSILHTFAGESFFDSFGDNMEYVGDVDGNGNPDLAVGSPGTNTLGMGNCGSVQVFDMVTGDRIQYAVGSNSGTQLGDHVSWIGDTTGDGKDNVLSAEPRFSNHDIYNGADDNGSGTCGMLALAEALVKYGPMKRSVLLIWVSGEEKGLWGSRAWAQNPVLPEGMKAVANINIDMIGRNAPDVLYVTPSPKHKDYNGLTRLMERFGAEEGFGDFAEGKEQGFDGLGSADDYYGRSDHAEFAKLGIPVCFLFAGVHDDYHRPTDTIEKIDYDKIHRVVKVVIKALDALQDSQLDL